MERDERAEENDRGDPASHTWRRFHAMILVDANVQIDVVVQPSAWTQLASCAHQAYRKAGGQRLTTLPDFFIGAHAVDSQLALLTRDPKRIRTYFPDVVLIAP
jgi:hypothetical protein